MKPQIRPKVAAPSEGPDLESFKPYLKIDKNGLDEAMAAQADLFFRVAEEYSLAVSRREEAKEALNTTDAELGQQHRTAKTAEEKVTEGQIKDRVQKDPKHQAAFTHYAERRKRAELLGALKEAFQERGRMLRDLGHLYATGYFTVTTAKGASSRIGRDALAEARGRTE